MDTQSSLAYSETSLASCTKTLLHMQRHRFAAIAFFGGWFTLTLTTFVFLVPALPPLKPTLAELSSSNRGSEVPHRRVRPSILAKEKGTEVEADDSYRFSNRKGPTFDDQPSGHNDIRRSYEKQVGEWATVVHSKASISNLQHLYFPGRPD